MSNDENLIKALGIESLPDEQKDKVIAESADLIQQRLFLRLMSELPDEKREVLTKLLEDRGNQDALNEFVALNAPDFTDWMNEETVRLKDELKDLSEIDI